MIKMKKTPIDFSDLLTYSPPSEETINMSVWHKKNSQGGGISFDTELNSETTIKETIEVYTAQVPVVITEADINRWILGGCPMY